MTKFLGYIGTYTKGDSEGIYSFTLNTEAEKIEHIKVADKIENPTYLSISKNNQGSAIHISSDGRFIYAGN
ncbi:6-phosphogluconolactonase [Tepidibacillus sp. HK-1]|nr:6-phosphogluconolactonase [Tepidibacillus sp. HK-1]